MKYTIFTVKGVEYKLRLTGAVIVVLEKKLGGRNLLSILMDAQGGDMPTVHDILLILHSAIQKFHHGITLDQMHTLFDDYVDEDNTYMDLIPVLMEVLKVSGFFSQTALSPAATTPASL